jgi:SAM-dependent methyltransferase
MIPDPTTPSRFTVMGGILLVGNLGVASCRYGNRAMSDGWWAPAFYDWMLAASEAKGLAARRRWLVRSAAGRVLEIGAGTGLNLRWYRPDNVDSVLALEPHAAMRARLAQRAATVAVPLEISGATVGAADLPAASFDTVVATLVLCCVDDLPATVASVARWLVPGGRLLFLEAVAAAHRRLPRPSAAVWSRLAGGCRFDRDILGAVRGGGLSVSDCDRFSLPTGGWLSASCVAGVAWRPPIGEPDPAMSVPAQGASV